MSDDRRTNAIKRSGLHPNMGDDEFDRHLRIAKAAVASQTVLFSIVEDERQFFPSSIGLPSPWAETGQTPLSHSFCKKIVDRPEPLVIDDALNDPRVADNLAQHDLGVGSYLGVPVRDQDGNVLGALCAIEPGRRSWTQEEIDVLTDVARSIEAELRLRHSQEVLRRRLANERLAQEYEQALAQLASATNRSETVQGVADELAERVGPSIGAMVTSIAIVESNELHFTHGRGVTPVVASDWTTAPLDTTIPMPAAIVAGRTIHLPDPASFSAYPVFVEVAEQLGLRSFRAIPFGDEGTGLLGVLGVGWSVPTPDADVPPALDRVVELASATLTRAWRFEIERDQARVLERVVLPTSLPDTGVYDVAGMYFAPAVGQRVGGDVYDVLVRPDGSVGVMVADAVGHDLIATRAVARLRHAIGVLIMEGYRPAAIMTAVNRYVAASPSRRLVTCVCLLFAADGSSVTVANAGHPQPILRSGPTVRPVGPVGESLLGRAATDYSEMTVALHRGDLVLSYTDGVIDRRGRSILDGERWLVDFVGQQPDYDAPSVAARLESVLLGSAFDDDMAFLIINLPTSRDHRTFRWSGPAQSVQLDEQRRDLAAWLDSVAPGASSDVLLLVAVELLTNARAASDPGNEVGLTVRRSTADGPTSHLGSVELAVTSLAPPFARHTEMPDAGEARGRGLAIVERLSRELEVEFVDGAVTVRAVIELS